MNIRTSYGPWYPTYIDNTQASWVRVFEPVKARTIISYHRLGKTWLTLEDSHGDWVYCIPVDGAKPVIKGDNEWIPWEGFDDDTP